MDTTKRAEAEDHLNGHSRVLPKIAHGVKDVDDRLTTFVVKRPMAALGVALVLGYALGRLASKLG
jgi:hypothetical protein